MLLSLIPLLLSLNVLRLDAPPLPKRPLWLSTYTSSTDRPGAGSSGSNQVLELNVPSTFVTYRDRGQCGFTAGHFTEIPAEGSLGWTVTVIPKRMGPDDVILSVSWARMRKQKVEAQGAWEVLMRPGDRVPIDVAGTPEFNEPNFCRMTSAEAVLEFDPVYWSNAVPGRGSVVSTDMWLVRRLPDGKDEMQQINIRGALNEEVPFYFEDVKSGDLSMSVLGRIRARARDGGAIALEFSAERQLHTGTTAIGRGFTSLAPGSGPLMFDTAQDVVSVEFPSSQDLSWKDLGSQRLSIRIRTRQIR